MSVLIGHTGFVGSNLEQLYAFDQVFHSRNIHELAGTSTDLVVCAGVQAKKWWANQQPTEDWAGIQRLLDVLASVKAERFVLISTVDVYPKPSGVTESTAIIEENHVYGTHRLAVEEFVRAQFTDNFVLRLPGLFGKGLKKNVIFDLLHDNCLEQINPEAVYQYYYLEHLWEDIAKAIQHNLRLLNLSSEPVKTADIVEAFFPHQKGRLGEAKPFHATYDMRSDHASLWGGQEGYLYSKDDVLKEIGMFIKQEMSP